MLCENSVLEKIKSFEEMSSGTSCRRKCYATILSFLPRDVFHDVNGEAELSPKVMESKRKYFLNEKGSAFLKFSFTGLILYEPTLSTK